MATHHIFDDKSAIHSLSAGDILYIHEGGSVDTLAVNPDSSVYVYKDASAESLSVEDTGAVYVRTGGIVSGVTLKAEGLLNAEEGVSVTGIDHRKSGRIVAVVSTGTTVRGSNEGGDFSILNGTASGFILYAGCALTVKVGCSAVNISVQRKGRLEIESGASAKNITLAQYGSIHAVVSAADGTAISGKDESGKAFSLQGGVAEGFSLYNGSLLTVKGDGTVQDITIFEGSNLFLEEAGAAARNVTVSTGSTLNITVSGTVLENIAAGGTVRLAENVTADARNSRFTFALSERRTKDGYILNNLSALQNAVLAVSVTESQTGGIYKLAEGAGSFAGEITLSVGGRDIAQSLAPGRSVSHAGRIYTLIKDGTGLTIEIVPPDFKILSAGQKQVLWGTQKDCSLYRLELSRDRNFSSVLRLDTSGTGYDLFNLSGGSYFARAKAGNVCTENSTFRAEGNSAPVMHQSAANGTADVFFARSNEVWDEGFIARHVGSLSQKGTEEGVAIAGKNRFRDVFFGSDDAGTLCLTDSANGDVLFLDDVYSEYGSAGRLSRINEIRAGAGDDVIDLTSARYGENTGNMTLRGGDGNDILWANSGANRLFGDAGNDRITGGGGNDLFSGGDGNDSLRGNGGTDLFVFGGNWGNDTIEQLENGAVVLWFEDGDLNHWNAETLTYKDGQNTVKISGVSAEQITLYFGAEEDYNGISYSELSELGAFGGSSSKCIWEQLA